jgi:antitoxin CptB
MLELDLILQAFLDKHYGDLPPPDQRAFQRLLSLPDTILIAYCQGTLEPEDIKLRDIVKKLR